MKSVINFIVLIGCLNFINGYKILGLFPHPAISHFRFFEPILHGLAEAGHNVTVVGLFGWDNAPENYKDIKMPGEILTNAIGLQVSAHIIIYFIAYYIFCVQPLCELYYYYNK